MFISILLGSLVTGGYAHAAIKDTVLDAADLIEHRIEKTADQLDVALAGKRYTKKPNKTRANFRVGVTSEEGGELRNFNDFGLTLRLPNVEEHWQARFSSYDEHEESRNLRQSQTPLRPRRLEPNAGLLFFQYFGKIKAAFLPRLQLKDPLQLSYVLRFESESERAGWILSPRLDLFADASKGTGEFFSFVIRRPLAPHWDLSIHNQEEYRDKGSVLETNHGFTIDHSLSNDMDLGISFVATSLSRPVYHLEGLSLVTSFSQKVIKNRLNYQISPFIGFAKQSHFKGATGITLATEIIF